MTPLGERIIAHTAEHAGITTEQLRGHSKLRPFTYARRIAATAMRDAGFSYPMIGQHLGHRDHSTIMAAIGKATAEQKTVASDILRQAQRFHFQFDPVGISAADINWVAAMMADDPTWGTSDGHGGPPARIARIVVSTMQDRDPEAFYFGSWGDPEGSES